MFGTTVSVVARTMACGYSVPIVMLWLWNLLVTLSMYRSTLHPVTAHVIRGLNYPGLRPGGGVRPRTRGPEVPSRRGR